MGFNLTRQQQRQIDMLKEKYRRVGEKDDI